MIRPVVVGYSGHPSCLHALLWAADAAAERRVPLRIVHAFSERASVGFAGSVVRAIEDARRDAEARVADAVARVQREFPDLVIDVVTASGRPSDVLRGASGDASMLVVSTRRQSYALQLLGSVTNRVTGRVACPVVSLPGIAGD